MNIFEILKLLFGKIGDQESVKTFIDSLMKIPKVLKNTLCIVIILGIIYFGYSKLYSYEINNLLTEVSELKDAISTSVNSNEYSNDIYYLIEAISLNQEVNKYEYEEEQLQLDLIEKYIKRQHSQDDPILVDIEAMKERNKFNYEHYKSLFNKVLSNCKIRNKQIENNDTVK